MWQPIIYLNFRFPVSFLSSRDATQQHTKSSHRLPFYRQQIFWSLHTWIIHNNYKSFYQMLFSLIIHVLMTSLKYMYILHENFLSYNCFNKDFIIVNHFILYDLPCVDLHVRRHDASKLSIYYFQHSVAPTCQNWLMIYKFTC